ncbi:Cathepsin O [Eumeta japonica]|uniref:Cathepsin O n=1 Tax=Eumeta variegata TaxID=151549 RepID=A0A4C1TUW1_EUMVA|nr:Cathepsin O [Eumeta japonica]
MGAAIKPIESFHVVEGYRLRQKEPYGFTSLSICLPRPFFPEFVKRFLKRVEKRNRPYIKANTTPAHGVTKFADMSEKEFRATYLNCPTADIALEHNNWKRTICKSILISEDIHGDVVNKSVDWRQRGYVGSVVNQGKCCGCWAASIVGVMETMAANKRKKFQQFSIQQLIDCDYDTSHCRGANLISALDYMCLKNMEVAKAEEYPDTWVDGNCQDIKVHGQWKLYGYTYSWNLDVNSTLRLLAQHGPLVVQVNAHMWDSYVAGGVLQWHCSDDPSLMSHAVQLVGYDLNAEVPYYIVRNSWGKDFGEDGYLRLQVAGNLCGVRNFVTVLDVTQ